MTQRLLIIGQSGGTHLGQSFVDASSQLGITTEIVSPGLAYGGSRLWRSANWHLLKRRPSTYSVFERHVLNAVESFKPTVALVTGLVPLSPTLFTAFKTFGTTTANFVTDDPFNPAHESPRYLASLQRYDFVLTPRQANRIQLYEAGARLVCDLHFGYDPRHVQSDGSTPLKRSDSVLFVGGADKDRSAILRPLCDSGVSVEVFGGYWHKYPHANLVNHGQGTPGTLASATAQAAVNLVLVRRANRDGHVMRSYEAAACGGCLLAEDTADHRHIYGDTVAYFHSASELIKQAKSLLAAPERRKNMAMACRQRIVSEQKNTYADRLKTILDLMM